MLLSSKSILVRYFKIVLTIYKKIPKIRNILLIIILQVKVVLCARYSIGRWCEKLVTRDAVGIKVTGK